LGASHEDTRMSNVLRLVRNFTPSTWPTRQHVEAVARRVDALHGNDAVGVMMRSWEAWHSTGDLPKGPLGELIVALREVVSGGLGPRPLPHPGAIA